jgi:hypothetical protein
LKVCKKCGSAEFYRNGRCKPCGNKRSSEWRTNNPSKVKENNGLHNKLRSTEKLREDSKKFRIKNPGYHCERMKKWRKLNPEKARIRSLASTLKWIKDNPAKDCARVAKRHASKLQATPLWSNKFFIEEIYYLAQCRTKNTGIKWHVDHIVPLQSKMVCGLHVEHNLQVIPASTNISKSNRYWPDMP